MRTNKARTWPTIDEADAAVERLTDAYRAVDEMDTRCHALLEKDMPWERPDETPVPTTENVAALYRLTLALRDHVEGIYADQLREWLERFEQLVASASTFEAKERGQRA